MNTYCEKENHRVPTYTHTPVLVTSLLSFMFYYTYRRAHALGVKPTQIWPERVLICRKYPHIYTRSHQQPSIRQIYPPEPTYADILLHCGVYAGTNSWLWLPSTYQHIGK